MSTPDRRRALAQKIWGSFTEDERQRAIQFVHDKAALGHREFPAEDHYVATYAFLYHKLVDRKVRIKLKGKLGSRIKAARDRMKKYVDKVHSISFIGVIHIIPEMEWYAIREGMIHVRGKTWCTQSYMEECQSTLLDATNQFEMHYQCGLFYFDDRGLDHDALLLAKLPSHFRIVDRCTIEVDIIGLFSTKST